MSVWLSVCFRRSARVLALWQSAATASSYSLVRRTSRSVTFPQRLDARPCPVGQFVNTTSTDHSSSFILVIDFRPSHPGRAFGPVRSADPVSAVIPVLSSTLLPGFAGRNFFTTTASSATSHQLRPWLSPWFATSGCFPDTVSGFPGYCTGSRLTMPPSSTAQV